MSTDLKDEDLLAPCWFRCFWFFNAENNPSQSLATGERASAGICLLSVALCEELQRQRNQHILKVLTPSFLVVSDQGWMSTWCAGLCRYVEHYHQQSQDYKMLKMPWRFMLSVPGKSIQTPSWSLESQTGLYAAWDTPSPPSPRCPWVLTCSHSFRSFHFTLLRPSWCSSRGHQLRSSTFVTSEEF